MSRARAFVPVSDVFPALRRTALRTRQRRERKAAAGGTAPAPRQRPWSCARPCRAAPSCRRRHVPRIGAVPAAVAEGVGFRGEASGARPAARPPCPPTPRQQDCAFRAVPGRSYPARATPLPPGPGSRGRPATAAATEPGGGRRPPVCFPAGPLHRSRRYRRENWRRCRASAKLAPESAPGKHPSANVGAA